MNTSKYKDQIISLFNQHHLLSLNEVHLHITEADYSTIYRNIDTLVQEGILQKIVFDRKRTLYELSEQNPSHHHFICQKCTQISDVPTQEMSITIPSKSNIQTIVIYGICQSCNI